MLPMPHYKLFTAPRRLPAETFSCLSRRLNAGADRHVQPNLDASLCLPLMKLLRLLTVALLPLAAYAQEDAKPAPPAPAPPGKERTIYVPYEDLSAALGDKGQGIFLPYAEFLEMWNQLNLQKKVEKEKPPADAPT